MLSHCFPILGLIGSVKWEVRYVNVANMAGANKRQILFVF